MAISRGRRSAPATRTKHGSSKRLALHSGAGESRHFKASPPQKVTVSGAVRGWTVPKAALAGLLKAYLNSLGFAQAGVGLQVLDDAAAQGLNLNFRGIAAPTDILSFPAETKVPLGFSGYLGDLALDLPYAWRKRGRFQPRFEAELAFLILHGLLHLLGHHHDSPAQERALWALQDRHFPPPPSVLLALRGLKPKA